MIDTLDEASFFIIGVVLIIFPIIASSSLGFGLAMISNNFLVVLTLYLALFAGFFFVIRICFDAVAKNNESAVLLSLFIAALSVVIVFLIFTFVLV